jgi:hypothetical protein
VISELKSQSDALIKQLKEETEKVKQFTIDFPDVYVIESE